MAGAPGLIAFSDDGLTVPNPDYKSKEAYALEPDEKLVTVWHSNAKRLEEARLAAPYDLTLRSWEVTDPMLIGDSSVDIAKRL